MSGETLEQKIRAVGRSKNGGGASKGSSFHLSYVVFFVKGQLISKNFLESSILPKIEQKKIDLTTMATQVELFSFAFLKN